MSPDHRGSCPPPMVKAGLPPPSRRGGTADQEGYFVSESSVFRLPKRFDLVESPAVFGLSVSMDARTNCESRLSSYRACELLHVAS